MAAEHFKVCVLAGGVSSERTISLQSGQFVVDALSRAGLEVVLADVTPDELDVLDDGSIDVFFPALHGRFGEDGQLQQILEDKALVYTGSGPRACRLALDKMASKKRFAQAGVATPPAVEFDADSDPLELEKKLRALGETFVVKPITHGSSVGVSIVEGAAEAISAARKCREQFGDCMIEKFIPGREFTVGILGERALPIIEIVPADGFYDYHAKYLDQRTGHLFDTLEDAAVVAKMRAAALDCFFALGCRHFARVDFILGEQDVPYALEINVIPGLTRHSNLPMAAEKAGLSAGELCATIVQMALAEKSEVGQAT